MSAIYLDNNATTPVLPEVLEEMSKVSREAYGNPGSRHAAGRRARQVLEDARETIAAILDAAPSEVIFTSGGTEASNLALFGLSARRLGRIVTLPGEHPATVESLKQIAPEAPHRHELPIDGQGLLVQESLEEVDWTDVILATALLAHNETGTIQDLSRLAKKCDEHRVPLHIDAVQAVGKIDVSLRQLGGTTMSIGAHKFYGPRGIGALLIREGTHLAPRIFGGHQEREHRPGTEPVALAAGMAKALQLWHDDKTNRTAQLSKLRDCLEAGLREQCSPVIVNGRPDRRLPNTLSIAFPGCEADALLVAIDLEGVCCSHGSACSSGSAEPAPILKAMNAPQEVLRSTLRLSVGLQNTAQEIDEAVNRISRVVQRLRTAGGAAASRP